MFHRISLFSLLFPLAQGFYLFGSFVDSPHSRRQFKIQQEIFRPKENHPTTFDHNPPFAYRVLNDPDTQERLMVGSRCRLSDVHQSFFEKQMKLEAGVGPARIGFELASTGCIDSKEFFESLEFYLRVRRRVRRPVLVDLACGHGLSGLFFAALDPSVQSVILVDARRPESFDSIFNAIVKAAPWSEPKVSFMQQNLYGSAVPCRDDNPQRNHKAGADLQIDPSALQLPESVRGLPAGYIAVHACGRATDRCLQLAAAAGAPIAAMPCCYTGCGQEAPYGVRRMLGKAVAADVGRAYALERAGYAVDFAAVPKAVTPLNRILVAVPRRSISPMGLV